MTDPLVSGEPATTPSGTGSTASTPPIEAARPPKPPSEPPARAAAPAVPDAAPPGAATRDDAGSGGTRDRGASGSQPSGPSGSPAAGGAGESDGADAENRAKRRRGSRGGRNRSRPAGGPDEPRDDTREDTRDPAGRSAADGEGSDAAPTARPPRAAKGARSERDAPSAAAAPTGGRGRAAAADAGDDSDRQPDEMPDRPNQNKPRSTEAAEAALVRKPRIGDTRPAPAADEATEPAKNRGGPADRDDEAKTGNRRRRGGRGRGGGADAEPSGGKARNGSPSTRGGGGGRGGSGNQKGGARKAPRPVEAQMPDAPLDLDLDEKDLKRRAGRERKGRPVGRYLMAVSVTEKATQIAVLEGRNLIEHYVSRPADDIAQIHGNIYLGKVQNVLPGMEAAFIDIGTPKNAVLYRGDVQYDAEDIEEKGQARIEQILKPKQTILCQVTKNPIAHKGARLTQEVSLPGRFVVLIPNSTTYGISKRLPDNERKRLRNVLDRVRPKGHGLIVRTAAEGVTAEEIERDVLQLAHQWDQISALAQKTPAPALLYREPDMAVRVIREEFNQDYRGIVIDDKALFEEVRSYVNAISPALADRVQHYDTSVEPLSMYERHHVHEQLHRALDRKVWLPSGGSLIIEHTEALTVIDVNTGKNVGSSSLEETVFRNNLEAAEEIAKQLRLRDIGGIIVIDFIDMEIEGNRREVIKAFRDALARDKTRTQVFDISQLGLVEMTRKRIGEGLLESFSTTCPECAGRGFTLDEDLIL
jgi:ribonuclease E